MTKRSKAAEERYEKAGNRPGVQFSIRLTEGEARLVDAKRGDDPRAAWVKALIRREIGSNSALHKKPDPKGRKG